MKLIVYLLLPLCLLSCRNNNEAMAIMNTAESLMTADPAKAKLLLETIDDADLNKLPFRAQYALLYSQALDKNYIDSTNDSLISIAVDYYDRKGTDKEKALSHYYHGRIYENGNDIDNAIKSYILSEQSAVRVDDCYLLGLISYSIGNLYSKQFSFLDALDKFQCAVGYFNKAEAKYNEAIVLSHMAKTYFLINGYDCAYEKLNEAISIYKSIDEDGEIQQLYESIAAIQLDQNKEIDSIKNVLYDCYSKTNSGTIPITSLGLWQSIYLKENKLDYARKCGRAILDNRVLFTDTQIAGCLTLMGKIESRVGNFEKAYQYSQQYEAIIDSTYIKSCDLVIQELEQKYNNQI